MAFTSKSSLRKYYTKQIVYLKLNSTFAYN